jgi:capsular exopolysaccharide synthesis family protein
VNSISREFIREKVEQRLGATAGANEILLEEANKLKNRLEKSERALQAYKEKNETAAFDEKQSIITEKLREFNVSYTEAQAKRLQLEADLNEIRNRSGDLGALLSLPSLAQDPAIVDLRQKLLAVESEYASLTNRYKPNYPKRIQAEQKVVEMRNSFARLVMNAPQLVKVDYERAVARENNLQQALKNAEKQALELNAKGIQYNVLLRDVESDRALYEAVLKRIKETDVTKGIEKNPVSVLQTAELPRAQVHPAKIRIYTMSSAISAFLCFFVFMGFQKLDSTIRTVDDAEKRFQIPVLGAIPVHGDRKQSAAQITVENPLSICSEAFRSFRASIEMLGRPEDRKVVLFTSAIPGEGKSTTSINFAYVQGQQEKKTLLIDLDLRRPSIAKYLELDDNAPGVTNYLLGKAPLNALVQKTAEPNTFVLTAGPRVPNPAEQLAGKWLKQLIQEASEQYDVVVLDTAPLTAVGDTLTILKHVQAIFLVIRSGKTPSPAIYRTIELIRRVGGKVAGLVLNYLPQSAGYGYYYYYSYKGGYYGKGVYGAQEDGVIK